MQTLGSLGPSARDAVPVLLGGLNHDFSSVRIDTADALGKIGPPAREAIPALTKAMNDLTLFPGLGSRRPRPSGGSIDGTASPNRC